MFSKYALKSKIIMILIAKISKLFLLITKLIIENIINGQQEIMPNKAPLFLKEDTEKYEINTAENPQIIIDIYCNISVSKSVLYTIYDDKADNMLNEKTVVTTSFIIYLINKPLEFIKLILGIKNPPYPNKRI